MEVRRRRWLRHGRRPREAALLSALGIIAGLRGVFAALASPNANAPVSAYLILAAIATGLAVVVWFLPWRWCLHLALAAGIGLVTVAVAVAAGGTGAVTASIGYVWITLYGAFFFSTRVSRAYVLACLGSFVVAIAINPFPGYLVAAAPLSLTVLAVAEVTARSLAALRRTATTDPLTNLLNRQGLVAAASPALAQARRSGRPLAVVIIDLNDFKLVNDRHGHAAGDRTLAELSTAWQPVLRSSDLVARYGGDEFVLVLPDTDEPAARELIGRLHSQSSIPWSCGLALARPGVELDELLAEADAELYRAKSSRTAVPRPRAESSLPLLAALPPQPTST